MKLKDKILLTIAVLLDSGLLFVIIMLSVASASGCSGYRSTVKSALVSNYQPTIHLGVQPSTNLYGMALCPPSTATPRSPDQTVTADAQVNAPIILCAEQINLMIFGGTAASNSVLSEIQVPLTGAP